MALLRVRVYVASGDPDFARGKDDCCAMRKLGVCIYALRFAAMCGNTGHLCDSLKQSEHAVAGPTQAEIPK